MKKTLRNLKRISLPRILLLICYYHYVGPNIYWHSQPRRIRRIIFAGEDLVNKAKARARILLLPMSAPLLLKKQGQKQEEPSQY